MKHVLILLVLFTQQAIGEQTVELSLGYQESSNYRIEQEILSEIKMDYSGDLDAAPSEIQSQFPMNLKMKQETLQLIETGNLESNNTYPVSMVVEKSKTYASINGADFVAQPSGASRLEGVTIKGIIHPDGKMEYKSASGEGATDDLKSMMRSIFEQMANSNLMAGKSVEVGETVPFKLPMSIPVGNMGSVNFEMEMRYTLEKVVNDIANFKINFSAIVSSDFKEANINITGSGSGLMTYNTLKKIPPLMTSEMQMDLKVPIKGGYLEITSISNSNIRTSVEKSLTSQANGTP